MMRKSQFSAEAAHDATHDDYESADEESSWTMYLEDFMTNSDHHDQQQLSSFSYSYENHSRLVSDAASLIPRDFSNACDEQALGLHHLHGTERGGGGGCGSRSSPRYFIKGKAKKALLHDDALEDTATSPANSPKVCYLGHMKQKLQKDDMNMIAKDEKSISGKSNTELDFNGRESECTELKKRGLCLVSFPMAANYFG